MTLRWLIPLLASVAVFVGDSQCTAQTTPAAAAESHANDTCPKSESEKTPDCIVFRLASDVVPGASIKLYGGYKIKGSDWPALALAAFEYEEDGVRDVYTCSAALLGPRVLLTAAHCVDLNSKTKFRSARLVVKGDREILVNCDPDPRYFADAREDEPYDVRVPRNSYDFALCELSWKGANTPAPLTQITFETIDWKTPLAHDESVLLTGYGCSSMSVVNHNRIKFVSDLQALRAGQAKIEKIRGEETSSPATVRIRSPNAKEPALCKGDSGGPMLSGVTLVPPPGDTLDAPATLVESGSRRVRGVNSSVDFDAATTPPEDYLSRVAALEGTGFVDYVKTWRKNHKAAAICGWDKSKDVSPCHGD